jgi:uncharacterized protein YecE (DUF72 family)
LPGHESTYASNYEHDSLKQWARRIRQWMNEGRDVHVYFDNDAKGYAPWNALNLARLLGLSHAGRDQAQFVVKPYLRKRRTSQRR